MTNTVIGFCGYARSGKDTAAAALTRRGWVRVALADALKRDVAAAVGASLTEAGGREFPGFDDATKTRLRPLLVEYGRSLRALDPGHWIRRADAAVARARAQGHGVVVTDIRYHDEALWIQGLGGAVIYIDRPGTGAANAEERDSVAELLDKSPPKFILYNIGSAEDLAQEALALAEILTGADHDK